MTSGAAFSGPSVLLSTAMVGIDDTAGKTLMFRALLDSGSQTSFITADAASKLNLARSTVDVKISGNGGRQQAAKESVSLLVGPQKLPITALVLNSIAGNIPSQSINLNQLKSMKSVALADKNFHQPGPVQLLLGADVYEDLFLDERKKDHGLHYRKSIFGWVVTGVLSQVRTYQCQSFQVAMELDLARFWEVEEIPRVKPMSQENRQCEEHYDTTTYVADDGCITVCLPFKSEARPSNNFHTAKQRLFALERKLKDHGDVKQQYRDFIKEFVDMGHLEEAPQTSGLCYYLPHHCVFKDSTTTKLRVVFDAGSKSPNVNSLNDCLLLGPRLQDDVFDILIRFRLHQYALSVDVAKMYRQVGLDKSDRDFHRILWRDYVTDEIRELRMTRVTYGVASSSYHSTRALQESGRNYGPNPNTVNGILNDFWVDDLLSGADTLEEACVLQDNLVETLNKNSHRSKLATLAINDAHKRTLYGGPTAAVAEMRRQNCVTQAMKKASACIKKCVTCFRFNSGPTQQLMGDLLLSRIEVPERAFFCLGLDFAGLLTFKNGTECVKGYVVSKLLTLQKKSLFSLTTLLLS